MPTGLIPHRAAAVCPAWDRRLSAPPKPNGGRLILGRRPAEGTRARAHFHALVIPRQKIDNRSAGTRSLLSSGGSTKALSGPGQKEATPLSCN
eukprot:6766241-Pyramimonas_sp.AAC.1